jgi:hypothetical protein
MYVVVVFRNGGTWRSAGWHASSPIEELSLMLYITAIIMYISVKSSSLGTRYALLLLWWNQGARGNKDV